MSSVAQQPGFLPPEAESRLAVITRRMQAFETNGVEELLALLDEYPDNVALLGHLAGAFAYAGRHDESIVVYERLERLWPGNLEVVWRLADRLVNLGHLDEAELRYRQVLEADPDSQDALIGVRYIQYLRRAGRDCSLFAGLQRPQWTDLQKRNREANLREFEARALRLKSQPSWLTLEGTLRCNFACQTCTKGYDPYYGEDLSEELRKRVEAEVMPTVTRISISGFGEPTLAPNFDQLFDMSMKNGSEVFFVTNASLLSWERLEKLTSSPVEIIISIDGATKETFETIRVNGRFDQILEKLAMIKKLRDIAMSQFVSFFSIHFVALRNNIHELPDVVRLAHRYGITNVTVLDFAVNHTPYDEQSLRYEPERANRTMDDARAVAAELGITLTTPPPYEPIAPPGPKESLWKKIAASRRLFPERNRFPNRCTSPWIEPYVRTDGMVVPCCTNDSKLGDLKTQTFAEVWNGWRYRFFRWRIETTLPPPRCRKCFLAWGINGGNAGNVIAKEGLLIKAFYWAEYRLAALVRRFRKEPLPKANYLKGRPMKKDGDQGPGTGER